eukprot:NODE_208_length_1643_cov_225.354454_g142_i0.p3 GENE.NODE_208_length_1643_cov_225.354454_g142_i0~~NODE_208_length_1643_cov_225.354454_g142_i0.p3  ORF type:complete len:96 (-),score=23.47 NODE_208_length_1643_cov_225.354454_g142_i0:550-837(-)
MQTLPTFKCKKKKKNNNNSSSNNNNNNQKKKKKEKETKPTKENDKLQTTTMASRYKCLTYSQPTTTYMHMQVSECIKSNIINTELFICVFIFLHF